MWSASNASGFVPLDDDPLTAPDPMQMSLSHSFEGLVLQESSDLINSAYCASLEVSANEDMAQGVIEDEDDDVIQMDLATSTDEDFSMWIDRAGLYEGIHLDIQLVNAVREIGSGAFSHIYLARVGDDKVAVKKVNLSHATRVPVPPEVMFSREVEYLRDLAKYSHPNIIKLIGACRAQDHGLMAIEYVEGGSLAEILHVKHVPFELMHQLHIAQGIANGFRFLHSQNIFHRDLTSENVLLTPEGVAKIIDFGFAVVLDPSLATSKLRPAGNARWRAPEITARKEYSFSADVYSFGIVFNEILTVRRPFDTVERSRDAAQRALRGERPFLYTRTEGTPLTAIIKACWAQEPTARPVFEQIFRHLSMLKK